MEILTDTLHRVAYATDASIYREMPLGVAYPKDEQDLVDLLAEARRRGTHLIPRAAGTSIAGQVVGDGIVVDLSRHFTRVLKVNCRERWAWVQPGVVRDELNRILAPQGLFFSPEASTSNRCCIGGMVGNNSCGTHSLVYGSTRHHVLALQGILSDGTRFDTSHLEGDVLGDGSLLGCIQDQLRAWAADPALRQRIADSFPDPALRRRSCGYALDEALEAVDRGDLRAALNALVCGSEGTLCLVTAVQVSLDPLPPEPRGLLLAECPSLPDSYRANLVVLGHSPVAVELMDGEILRLCQGNPAIHTILSQASPSPLTTHLSTLIATPPAALLIAEFNGAGLDSQADALESDLLSSGLARRCFRAYGDDIARVWDIRKAGLGVLTGSPDPRKPVGVVEDTAVAPERLPAYLDEFHQMMRRHGLSCVYYGHIGTGELHLRPVLDLRQPGDLRLFRQVAEETALLVRKYRGSLSGEHGDGRLRGEFIPLVYGQEVYGLFLQLKRVWDPDGLLNRHKIVDTPPMDTSLRYAVGQGCPDKGLAGAVEQCNGAAVCRRSSLMGGTMCPTYKMTRDELQSTRARANILREYLAQRPDASVTDDLLLEVLYSCLACKGCHGECPSGFDMTRLRAEVLQRLYRRHGTPFRSWMVARMALVERLGRLVRPLYNHLAAAPWSSALIKRAVSFTPERAIPLLPRHTMRQLVKREPKSARPAARRVYLFADEFTNLQESLLGLTFARLLTRLGYEVVIPRHVESGRAAISKGCLDLAARYARRNVLLLRDIVSDDTPLVGIEPSCILSFRDEYPKLVPDSLRADAERLGRNSLLFDEFIMREVARGNISSAQFAAPGGAPDIWLHGHCHQKALVGIAKTADMLHLVPGARVHVIPASCCGMAGSFGYEKEHYRTSLAIGETVLFPTLRKIPPASESTTPSYVAAPGTSCRQQILDGTGIHAFHPIEILYRHLAQ